MRKKFSINTNPKNLMSMKRFIIPMLLLAALSSCSTANKSSYSYSARQSEINRQDIDAFNQRVAVVVDYSRRVTATSEFQASRKDAITEAEFLCIQNEKIDVVVDPIYKVECDLSRNRYKATIIGFAGKYEVLPSEIDETKSLTREQIENYKLLTDPGFAVLLYSKGGEKGGKCCGEKGGDSYVINMCGGGCNKPAPAVGKPSLPKPQPKAQDAKKEKRGLRSLFNR